MNTTQKTIAPTLQNRPAISKNRLKSGPFPGVVAVTTAVIRWRTRRGGIKAKIRVKVEHARHHESLLG